MQVTNIHDRANSASMQVRALQRGDTFIRNEKLCMRVNLCEFPDSVARDLALGATVLGQITGTLEKGVNWRDLEDPVWIVNVQTGRCWAIEGSEVVLATPAAVAMPNDMGEREHRAAEFRTATGVAGRWDGGQVGMLGDGTFLLGDGKPYSLEQLRAGVVVHEELSVLAGCSSPDGHMELSMARDWCQQQTKAQHGKFVPSMDPQEVLFLVNDALRAVHEMGNDGDKLRRATEHLYRLQRRAQAVADGRKPEEVKADEYRKAYGGTTAREEFDKALHEQGELCLRVARMFHEREKDLSLDHLLKTLTTIAEVEAEAKKTSSRLAQLALKVVRSEPRT